MDLALAGTTDFIIRVAAIMYMIVVAAVSAGTTASAVIGRRVGTIGAATDEVAIGVGVMDVRVGATGRRFGLAGRRLRPVRRRLGRAGASGAAMDGATGTAIRTGPAGVIAAQARRRSGPKAARAGAGGHRPKALPVRHALSRRVPEARALAVTGVAVAMVEEIKDGVIDAG